MPRGTTFSSNLRYAAPRLQSAGIKLLIEPINTRDIPGFFLTDTQQAVDIIEAVGSDNLFVQYDIYHMQIMEGDLATTIERHLPRIAHMQLAEVPGRHEPGTGEIDYGFLLDFIDRAGYTGGSAASTFRRRARSRDWGGRSVTCSSASASHAVTTWARPDRGRRAP